jgi:hypothetical protein
MVGGDLTTVDGQPKRSRADFEKGGGIGQVQPWLLLLRIWLIARDAMMATECSHSLSRPAIPTPGEMTITVQNAGDEVITADTSQNGNRFDQLAGCLCRALTTAAAWEAQLGMNAAFPVKREYQFAGGAIHIHENLPGQRLHLPSPDRPRRPYARIRYA